MALPVFVRGTAIYGGGGSANSALTTSAMLAEAGGYLFVGITHYTAGINVSAVVDTAGNTFARAGTVQGGDANQDNEIWYTPNPIVGTTSNAVIVRYTGLAAFRDVSQGLFSWGGTTSITYDTEATHAFPSGSSMASNTLSVADEGLVIGNWVAYDQASSVSAGTAAIAAAAFDSSASMDLVLAYRIFTASTVAATASLVKSSTGQRYSVVAKSFKGVAAGTSTPSTALGITLPLTGAGQG